MGMTTTGERRPEIPRPLERDVRTEAGHRCAIPTCRATSGLQIHHIVPWAKVQEHTFDNLILLCANCHSRVTNGEIDTLSVRHYKANLSVVSNRYGDLERRVLEIFANNPNHDAIELPGGNDILMWYLLRDGYVVKTAAPSNPFTVTDEFGNEVVGREAYRLTPSGREFVTKWVTAQELE